MTEKVLVTGGAGFIGSYVVENLIKQEKQVIVLDDLSTGMIENINRFEGKIDFYEGSIFDKELLSEVSKGADTVYHLAAEVGVDRVIGRDEEVWENDFGGTKNVLEAAIKAGAEKFLFTSTSEVYGRFDQDRLPMKEDIDFSPDTVYGEAKLAGEVLVAENKNKIFGVSTRYFNAYGPGQTLNGYCVPHFIDAALKGEDIHIHSDGSQTRDLTYVGDAVRLTMRLMDDDMPADVNGESFNIGTGLMVSMNDLASKIIELTDSSSEIIYIPMRRPTDGYHKQGDASKILSKTGHKPEMDLEEGLDRTIYETKKVMGL